MSETTTAPAEDPNIIPPPVALNENATEAPANEATEPEAKPEPQRETWYEKRIRIQAQNLTRSQREADALRAELEAVRAAQTGQDNKPPPQQPRQEQPDVRQAIETRAAQLSEAREFNAACNVLADAGSKAHADFGDAVQGWLNAGLDLANKDDHRDLVKDIIALPNAHDIWYALGKDPDRVSELLDMTPRQQARALAEFSSGAPVKAAPVVSKAPAPAKPAQGAPRGSSAGSKSIYDSNLSWAEFKALREKGVTS